MLQQIALFAQANPDPQAQQDYARWRNAVGRLEVPAALVPRLTAILEVSLSGERIRRTAGPGAHLALTALFQKTPRGKGIRRAASRPQRRAGPTQGPTTHRISAAQRGPGIYSPDLGTPACRIVIRFEPDGVRVESLDVGSE